MEWWMYLIIGIVVFAVLALFFTLVNRKFIRKYGFSLYGGGIALLIGAVSIAFGVLTIIEETGALSYVLIGIGALMIVLTLVLDFRKCGALGGIGAFLLQLLFCVPSILVLFDLIFNKGRNTFSAGNSVAYSKNRREYERSREE